MHRRCKQKTNSNFVNRLSHAFGLEIDPHAKSLQNVGRSALGAYRAISVLRYADARACDNKRCGG